MSAPLTPKDEAELRETFGGCATLSGNLVLGVPTGLLKTYVLLDMLRWFVYPLFPSFPHLGMASAFGLWMVTGFVFAPAMGTREDDRPLARARNRATASVVASLMTWGVSAIVHHFWPLVQP